MKAKRLLSTLALSLLAVSAVGVGLSVKEHKSEEAAEAATKTYYIIGTMNSWDSTDKSYPITDDGTYSYLVVDGTNSNVEFKIVTTSGSWDNALGYSNVSSSCGAYSRLYENNSNIGFYVGGSDVWKRSVYAVKIVSGSIYVETTWIYHGSDASKSYGGTTWAGSTTHYLVDGGPSVTWSFGDNESFKLTDRCDAFGTNEYNAALSGTANSNTFTGGSGSDIVCSKAGSFTLALSSGTLYVDYADGTDFYYNGSDASKSGTAWTPWTDAGHAIKVNGSPVVFSFNYGEQFGLTPDSAANGRWFGAGCVTDFYYDCFVASGDNIFVRAPYDNYTVAVTITNHVFRIVLAANQTTHTSYVLDLNGNLLSSNPRAHYFYYDGDHDITIGTAWPGVEMSVATSATNIYEFSYWDLFSTVIFNDGTTQTIDESLSGNNGKCMILSWAYSGGYWTSNTWVSLEAARFIDSYMKFETAHEDDGGSGACKASGWYSAAKTAYGSLSSTAKSDINGYSLVADRLAAWARANGETFNASTGAFSSAMDAMPIANMDAGSTVAIFVVVVTVAGLAIGGYFFLRKKKEN